MRQQCMRNNRFADPESDFQAIGRSQVFGKQCLHHDVHNLHHMRASIIFDGSPGGMGLRKSGDRNMERRDFLKGLAATGMLAGLAARANTSPSDVDPRVTKISAFDYDGVRLHDSRWNDQYLHAREFYFNVSNDDILQGFRAKAGLPAPGKPLGGWCDEDSSTVFGQWLSGMSRMYRATGDQAMGDKAAYLLREFSKTVGSDGNCRMNVYPYEKLVCGLVD